MAYAAVKYCGRVLLVILLLIQSGAFSYFQITGLLHSLRLWQDFNIALVIVRLLSLLYSFIALSFSVIFLLDATLNDRYILSRLFFGWRLYIGVVFVPNVIGLFGTAFYFDDDKLPSGTNGLTLTVCATPILLLLLLITTDDSFSSKNHSDLVRNLSILMDLISSMALKCWTVL